MIIIAPGLTWVNTLFLIISLGVLGTASPERTSKLITVIPNLPAILAQASSV